MNTPAPKAVEALPRFTLKTGGMESSRNGVWVKYKDVAAAQAEQAEQAEPWVPGDTPPPPYDQAVLTPQSPSPDVERQADPFWKIASVWSSSNPKKQVLWLVDSPESASECESHNSFIRWVAVSPQEAVGTDAERFEEVGLQFRSRAAGGWWRPWVQLKQDSRPVLAAIKADPNYGEVRPIYAARSPQQEPKA